MAKPVGVDRAEPAFQKPPVDDPAEPRQRMPHIDNLVEPRSEKIALSAVPPLLRPHRIILPPANGGRESRPAAPINLQEIASLDASLLQKPTLAEPRKPTENLACHHTSRTTI